MSGTPTDTRALLERWHGGDRDALKMLLQRDLPWIKRYVHFRLGPSLRRRTETDDIVQDAVLEFLRFGPRFVIENIYHYRHLLTRVIENTLGHKYEWFTAKRRAMSRELPLPSDSALQLSNARSVTSPSQSAQRNEREAWVRLGLELVGLRDREVILLRIWDGLSFAEIGERLKLGEDATRMRFQRAVHKLAREIQKLVGGRSSSSRDEMIEEPNQ